MKYVDASAVLRLLFDESGVRLPLAGGDHLVSSGRMEVETFPAVERVRLFCPRNRLMTTSSRCSGPPVRTFAGCVLPSASTSSTPAPAPPQRC